MNAARSQSYRPPMPVYGEEVWDSEPYRAPFVNKSMVVPNVPTSSHAGDTAVQHLSFDRRCVTSMCAQPQRTLDQPQHTVDGVSLSGYINTSDLYLPPEPTASGIMPVPSTPKLVAKSCALYQGNGQSSKNVGLVSFHSHGQYFPDNPLSMGNVGSSMLTGEVYLPPPIPPNSGDIPDSPDTYELPLGACTSQRQYQPLYRESQLRFPEKGSLNVPTVSTGMYLPPEPVADKISGCPHPPGDVVTRIQRMNASQYIVPEPVTDTCRHVGRDMARSQGPAADTNLPCSTYIPPEPFDDGISESFSEFTHENVFYARELQQNTVTSQYIVPLPPLDVVENVERELLSSSANLGRKSCEQTSTAVDFAASLENCSPTSNEHRSRSTRVEHSRQPRNSLQIKESESVDNVIRTPHEIHVPKSALETGPCTVLGGGIHHQATHDSNNNPLGATGSSIRDQGRLASVDRLSSVSLHQVNSPVSSLVAGNAGEPMVPAKAPSLAASNISVNSKTTSTCAGNVSGSALPPHTTLMLPDVEATIINMTRLIIKQRAQLMTIISPMLTANPDNLVLMAMKEHYVSLEQEMNRLAQAITLASHLRSSGMCEGLLRQPILGPISLLPETADGNSVVSEPAIASNIPSHTAVVTVEEVDRGTNGEAQNGEAQLGCGVTRDLRSDGEISSTIDVLSVAAAAAAVSNSPSRLVDPQRIAHCLQPINIRTD